MAKWAHQDALDALLDKAATSTKLVVSKTEAKTVANANTNKLAEANLSGGDFTKSAGTPNGRKIEIAKQESLAVTATGDATHVLIHDGTNVLWITTVDTQTLTSGNTVTVPKWSITVADPV